MRYGNLALVMTILGWVGCSKPTSSLFTDGRVKQSVSPYVPETVYKKTNYTITHNSSPKNKLTLTYLGAGGFYIRNDDAGVLIDPFFSNTCILRVGILGVKTKKKNVEWALDPITDLDKTKAIYITHGHYDHLMDAPYVSQDCLANPVPIHTSTSGVTMINQISTAVNIEPEVTTWYSRGTSRSFPAGAGSIEVWPIATSHAPHTKKIRKYDGESEARYALERTRQRRATKRWALGQPFAFLVDFKNSSKEITYRIYIQSSAARPKHGWLHPSLQNREIDLAILGAASFHNTDDYPEALIDHLGPDRIIICHWEDFFVRYKRDNKRTVRLTNVRNFINRLNAVFPYDAGMGEMFTMPNPGVEISIAY